MKAFRFALDRVLDFRKLQSDAERAKLDQLLVQRTALLCKNEELAAEARTLQGFTTALPAELTARENYRAFLRRQEQYLRSEIAKIDRLLAEQRQRVLEAERRRDLLEKLKHRRHAEWNVAFDRELEELAADAFRARLHAARHARIQER